MLKFKAMDIVLLIAAAEHQGTIRTRDIQAKTSTIPRNRTETDLGRHGQLRLTLPLQAGLNQRHIGRIDRGQATIGMGPLLNRHAVQGLN